MSAPQTRQSPAATGLHVAQQDQLHCHPAMPAPTVQPDYAACMESVARELLGEPNGRLSKGRELRFGAHGSMAVDIEAGRWFDHEADEGGGVLGLIQRQTGRDDGKRWLTERGYLQTTRSEPPTFYDYCDEHGEVLFQVVRHANPKTFRQRAPDGRGGWTWSVKGVRQVPYCLPEILARPDDPVMVVEGEKDADRLRSLGMLATCNAGGAGKWRESHAEPLRGRRVYVLPDNDEAGERHAEDVARSLSGARIVRLPGLPPKGDVSDWINAGHTADELRALCESAPITQADPGGVTLLCAAGITSRPIRWLWRYWLARGKFHVLAGAPGTGKTTIALSIAAAITRGSILPDGTIPDLGNVLLWSGEDDPADTLVPRLLAAGADLARVHIVGDVGRGENARPFDPARDLAALERQAAMIGDVALLIADPVVSAVSGDSHKNTEVRRALQPMVHLATRLDCAVLGISHFSKGTSGRDPVERVTGSIAFGALARLVLVTAKGEDDARLLARAKSNIGPDGGGFAYSLEQVEVSEMETSRVAWGAPLEGSARELLAGFEETEEGATSADEAEGWLREILAPGPMVAGEVLKHARAAGLQDKALRVARERMGIKPQRRGFGAEGGWYWSLPIDAQRCPVSERASMGTYGEKSAIDDDEVLI